MRRAAALAVLLLGPASAASAQALPPHLSLTAPPELRGEWNADLKACGTSRGDGGMTIAADRIRYYESGGPIRAVVRRGAREIMIVAELSGEGETWLDAQAFTVGADGSTLTVESGGEKPFVRHRCKPKAR